MCTSHLISPSFVTLYTAGLLRLPTMQASWLAIPVLLFSILILVCTELAQPPANLKPKVFVIGFSKTGTTSFGDALAQIGYKRLGWKDIRSRHMVHSYVNGEYEPLIEQTRFYDAFEDLPWPHLYREMAEMYPDSKFILSLRKDDATWLKSMRRHVGRGKWIGYSHFYGAVTFDGNEETIRQSYTNHTARVREYFAETPERYLELTVDDGDVNWSKLCGFVGCPGGVVPDTPFPRSNAASTWRDGSVDVIGWLHWMWGWTITRIEEITTYLYYEKKQPSARVVLSFVWRTVDTIEMACSEMYYKHITQPAQAMASS